MSDEEPERGGPPRLARLPPGRHGLSREFVAQNQRDRLAAGIIAAVAEHGYHDTTISQIAANAGVSRRTFYTYFESKEECFYETYRMVSEFLIEAARQAAAPQPDWPRKARAKLETMLDAFAANPDLVRFLLIAPSRAGQKIAAHQREAMERAIDDLVDGAPPPPATREVSTAARISLVGGAAALISRRVEAGEGERLPELATELLELLLTPFVGHEEAARISRS